MLNDIATLCVFVAPQMQPEPIDAHEDCVITCALEIPFAFDAAITDAVFRMNLKYHKQQI